jgi:hypothetical protein
MDSVIKRRSIPNEVTLDRAILLDGLRKLRKALRMPAQSCKLCGAK